MEDTEEPAETPASIFQQGKCLFTVDA